MEEFLGAVISQHTIFQKLTNLSILHSQGGNWDTL